MQGNAPLISVIMPLFNRAHLVGEAIESVLAQTFTEWELVIVNDGSTDNSLHVARGYAERDQRIRVLDQQNGGLVAARNNGIAAARGEYIFPLDDDDKISPDALSELFAAARLGLGDVIHSETELFVTQEGLFKLPLPTRENMIYANAVVCSALYKKSDWERYGGYDSNMKGGLEDWEFWLNFIAEGRNFYRIPKTLFYYRVAPGSMLRTIPKDVCARLKRYMRKKHSTLFSGRRSSVRLSWAACLYLAFVKLRSERRYRKKLGRLSIPDYPRIEKPKLIMTLLVKDEADIIGHNLKFHKAMGVDGFIVTDNMSTDGSREILQEYKDKGWILDIIDEPGQDYSQSEWVHRMASLARHKYHADWIINADADEFWYPQSGDLKAEIANSPANMLFVQMHNMLDNGGDWIDNTSLIKKNLPEPLAAKLIESGRLGKYHQFKQHPPKVIVRAKEYVHIHQGNHDADMVIRHKPRESEDVMICHFNSRGREHFKRKMLTCGAAYEHNIAPDKEMGAHWRHVWDGFKDDSLDMDSEYDKFVGNLCMDEVASLIAKDETIRRFFNGTAKEV
ncbi:MAG: glycosyltransferase [Betaproteobacteria bacterium]|nr:glycosyltransferase [Betaproteobacteria bacterium]